MTDEWSVTSEVLISYFIGELLLVQNWQINAFVFKSILETGQNLRGKKLISTARLKIPRSVANFGFWPLEEDRIATGSPLRSGSETLGVLLKI